MVRKYAHPGGRPTMTLEDQQEMIAEQLAQDRRKGVTELSPWPSGAASLSQIRPMVDEVAVAVSWDQFFLLSAESFSNVRYDTPMQQDNAVALAFFMQMISNQLAGRVTTVNSATGYVIGSSTYNMNMGDGRDENRSKVEVDVTVMPRNKDRPLEPSNIACLIIRARAVDWQFTFADALKWTVMFNTMLAENGAARAPSTGSTSDAKKIAAALQTDRNLSNDFPATVVYDVVMRPDHYRGAIIKWAADERKHYKRKAMERLQQDRLRTKRAAAEAAAKDGAAPDDVELDEDDIAAIKDRATDMVTKDMTLPANVVLEAFNMEGNHGDRRWQACDQLVRASIDAMIANDYNAELFGSGMNPNTRDGYLDTRCYKVGSMRAIVATMVLAFVADSEVAEQAMAEAARLDAGMTLQRTDLRNTKLNPTRLFTLQSALDMARKCGADESLLALEDWYAAPNDPAAVGQCFDPEAACGYDTVALAIAGKRPLMGRTVEQYAAALNERGGEDSEVMMAPYYARVIDSRLTRSVPMGSVPFNKLRLHRFWFAEDDTPERIEEAYAAATRASPEQLMVFQTIAQIASEASGTSAFTLKDDAERTALDLQAMGATDDEEDGGFEERRYSEAQRTDIARSADIGNAMMADDFVSLVDKMHNDLSETLVAERQNTFRRIGCMHVGEPMSEPELGANAQYESNFSLEEQRLRPIQRRMETLALLAPEKYQALMPKWRRFCAMAMARIYTSSAHNNGGPMRAVRLYERDNWHDSSHRGGSGAYIRVGYTSGLLSPFGNRVAGDIMALAAMRDVRIGHFHMWDSLTGVRGIAFDNSAPCKLHSLSLSKSGTGKSLNQWVLSTLSIPGTISDQVIASTQSGVDALACDDMVIYVDEAPREVTHSGQQEDPEMNKRDNVMRSVLSSGVVSVSRSVRGKFTTTFTTSRKITWTASTNTVHPPPNYEMSMLMRLQLRRLPDNVTQTTNVYCQHNIAAGPLVVQKNVLEQQWCAMQGLLAIMGKMVQMYALPKPDTRVVSCLAEDMISRVDAFYPRWQEFMRASTRLGVHVRGWAMFNAAQLMFNSPQSPYAPERNAGAGRGFDVLHMMPCARYMFGTSEMLAMSVMWTLDEAVCTEAHMLMYALATKCGYRASLFEHLFAHGGRDHRESVSSVPSKNTVEVHRTDGGGANSGVSVTPELRFAARYVKQLMALSEHERSERFARFICTTTRSDGKGGTTQYNRFGEEITPDMRTALAYEQQLLAGWQQLSDDQRQVLLDAEETNEDGIRLSTRRTEYCYKTGGWRPEHWDRASAEEMPEFWRNYENQLRAMESRNLPVIRWDAGINFAPLDKGHGNFDPNYVRYSYDGKSLDPSLIDQALGSYNVSRPNWQYLLSMYLRDQKAQTMVLPKLKTRAINTAEGLEWCMTADNRIVTESMPVVRMSRGGGNVRGGYIDISTVWLFMGAFHNHTMTMLCNSLEDDHVPEEGRTITLPLSNPSAPFLMESLRLQRRAGHFIRVPNPMYANMTTSNAALNTAPAQSVSSAFYNSISIDSVLDSAAASSHVSAASSVAIRAAMDASNAIGHGLTTSRNRMLSAKARELQRAHRLEMIRYRGLMESYNTVTQSARADYRARCVVAREKGLPMPAPPNEREPPVEPAMPPEMENSMDGVFMTPDRPTLCFMNDSVDDTLYRDFLLSTGQKPSPCKWSVLESQPAVDMRITHSLLSSVYTRLRQTAENAFENHDQVDELASVLPGAEGDGDGHRADPQMHARDLINEQRDRLGDAEEALGARVEQLGKAISSWPDPYMPDTRAPWVELNEHHAQAAVAKIARARISFEAPRVYVDNNSVPEYTSGVGLAFARSGIGLGNIVEDGSKLLYRRADQFADPPRDVDPEDSRARAESLAEMERSAAAHSAQCRDDNVRVWAAISHIPPGDGEGVGAGSAASAAF